MAVAITGMLSKWEHLKRLQRQRDESVAQLRKQQLALVPMAVFIEEKNEPTEKITRHGTFWLKSALKADELNFPSQQAFGVAKQRRNKHVRFNL
mmetsp:Transcript_29499/g.43516  ORF Transcript_29499/g.43516 Transcript_29499/m.43516 type:complete len:94 (-) Transcript_29499:537-818(-)